ncbi:MAG TPA: ATP-binding protein [Terracidiphilus sp.]
MNRSGWGGGGKETCLLYDRQQEDQDTKPRMAMIRSKSHFGLWLLHYGIAIFAVAAALILSLALRASFGNPAWFFFPAAVLTATWVGGRGPGWLAALLSTLAVQYYFVPPTGSLRVNLSDLPYFGVFVLCVVAANWVIAWRRDADDAVREARDQLEVRVAERTVELKAANEALVRQMEEQRQTEEALQLTRSELARVVRITTIGELTASIAHEVNQPLAAVVANADACVAWLGLQEPNLGEARAAAERAVQGATRASEVITRIRSLIHKAPPERLRVQLNPVIEETCALAAGQASRNEVMIRTELAADLPAVIADRIQLQQVLLNLVVNGIEAMSGVSDRARELTICSRTLEDGQVSVAVGDTGIGVTAETMARLFEPFFTTRTQGIGMGLPISRSIIEAHGGRLWAESTPGRGTTLQFTLRSAEAGGA